MESTEKLYQLTQRFKQLTVDLRAEVFLALAGVEGIDLAKFVALNSGDFKRDFQRDLWEISLEEDGESQEYVAVKLHREGIYDLLPEGLFYHSSDPQKSDHIIHAAQEVRRNKKIEAEIRKFFAPVENAVFSQKLNLELEENAIIRGLELGEMDFDLMGFYGIPLDIPSAFIPGFLRIMPYRKLILGDLPLTVKTLSMIVGHPMAFDCISYCDKGHTVENQIAPSIGFGRLGTETILGAKLYNNDKRIRISIGPIGEEELPGFLEGGQLGYAIDVFNGFFMPMEADILIDILVKEDVVNMDLGNMSGPILGYSSRLELTDKSAFQVN